MSTPKKTILLVDDDAEFVEGNRLLLESEGYRVLTAPDGAAGLDLARSARPDLMILDVMMTSDTEGIDVSRLIKEDPDLRRLPVILLTGIRKAMNLPFAFEADKDWLPVKRVLEKPVRPEALLEEIRKHV